MVSKVLCFVALALFGSAVAQPAKAGFWKGTPMDGMVEEMRSGCVEGSDPAACIKYKVMSLLDSIFKKDSFQVNNFPPILITFNVIKHLMNRSTFSRSPMLWK